jgi:carbamoyl-phosphate synthase large subunit
MSNEKNSDEMRILFTCVGRRVSLLRSFCGAAEAVGFSPLTIGLEVSKLSSALHLCDEKVIVNHVGHHEYIDSVLDAAKEYGAKLIVPTVDLDLLLFAENRRRFEDIGCRVLISEPDVIRICQDKRRTYEFLRGNGFNTPESSVLDDVLARGESNISFPKFLKPWDGAAGRGNAKVVDFEQLQVIGAKVPNCFVQDFIDGTEYTCDVFVDFDMNVRCVVPRRRIEVRSGEVSKAQVVKDRHIMERAAELVRTLGAGPGVITIQLIKDGQGDIYFIEINPRFGGGVPLSIRAGANFPLWIMQLMAGQEPAIEFDGFEDDLYMLRFDSEVWVRGRDIKGDI